MSEGAPRVAYFCMEFGLDPSFPIYAGGLGVLAGDHLKSARDLGINLVGVGLLYREGYTRQRINEHGWPMDEPAYFDRDFLIDTGEQITVEIRGGEAPVRIWKTEAFGNAPLYLLDTDVPGSDYWWVTKQLYGGVAQDRIAQEIVLGIGGVRALRKLGIEVDVYHFNEGHAALAGIELIREKMAEGRDFETAWAETRRQVVFTTHTPVPAGNESHDLDLLEYMGAYNGLTREQMIRIGGDPFGMTVAGLRLSCLANGVTQLHGLTARSMWSDIDGAAPILSITNGTHIPTWQEEAIRNAQSDDELWEAHMDAKRRLIQEVHKRTGVILDENRLLIGFARRAAAYKRADLIFSRPDVIEPLLSSGEIQLLFSGKAHPQDEPGKEIIARLIRMSRQFPENVVFVEDYDIHLARLMVSGCDVWLNNPQRPLEASGTSGMKAALNGVLNLSVLDGWWVEGCWHGVNGWQIGNAYEGPGQYDHDAYSLYKVLMDEVMPTYYNERDRWIRMMRESIEMARARFSSDRMVQEYHNLMYLPAASMQRNRKALPVLELQQV